jgi:hypothetical protein
MQTVKGLLKIYSNKRHFFLVFFCLCFYFTHTSLALASLGVATTVKPSRISVNNKFDLLINISWQGDAEDYIVVPPEPELPEAITKVSASFSSTVSENKYLIKYHYILKAEKKGEFTLKPQKIKYWARGSDQENVLLTDGVSLEVVRFAFLDPGFMWYIIITVAVLFGIVIALAITTNQRVSKKKKHANAKEVQGNEYILQKLNQCKQSKLKGDYRGFYQSAFDVVQQVAGDDKAFMDSLTGTLEKVQFGGYRPAAEEIERVLRHIEKKSAETFSDKKNRAFEYQKYCK